MLFVGESLNHISQLRKNIWIYREKVHRGAELLNSKEYSCPYCYSSDRDRMIIMFISMIRLCMKDCINILEIAPSGALQKYLYKYWGEINYYTADLYMNGVDYNVDIQDMAAIENEAFDFFVCSHVLEHVQDDMKAMRELNRVLEQDGLGIVIVPLDLSRTDTDEEWGLSARENVRRFGQEDHVRAYCKKDYIARLEQAGFGVWQLDKSFFAYKIFEENALIETSTLYLVYKNKEIYNNREKLIEKFKDSHQGKRDRIEDYLIVSGECNYWVDTCDIYENMLRIWGWIYIIGENSKNSKVKIMLKNKKREYILGTDLKKSDNIQEAFGSERDNYSFSGVNFFYPLSDMEKGVYSICFLIKNGRQKYKIPINKRFKVK